MPWIGRFLQRLPWIPASRVTDFLPSSQAKYPFDSNMFKYFRRSEVNYAVPHRPFPLLPPLHKGLRFHMVEDIPISTQCDVARFMHAIELTIHPVQGLLYIRQPCAYFRASRGQVGDPCYFLGYHVCAPAPPSQAPSFSTLFLLLAYSSPFPQNCTFALPPFTCSLSAGTMNFFFTRSKQPELVLSFPTAGAASSSS